MTNFITGLGLQVIPWYVILICAVCVYFLGNVNPAIIIGRAKGVDIRTQGSGNAGTTNAMRSLGKKTGAIVFVIDAAKGWAGYYVPMLIFMQIGLRNEEILHGMVSDAPALLCGLCVVVGHMYPAVFGFRGGKGVATAFGVLLAASWLHALILIAIVIVVTLICRYVSLSVMIAVAACLVFAFAFGAYDPLWAIILLALIVWKHRENIKRLVKGQENKLSLGGKK